MRQRSSYGWLELIVGILLTVLGIYSFFRPVDYLTTLIVIYGVAALVTGIADIVFCCWVFLPSVLRAFRAARLWLLWILPSASSSMTAGKMWTLHGLSVSLPCTSRITKVPAGNWKSC